MDLPGRRSVSWSDPSLQEPFRRRYALVSRISRSSSAASESISVPSGEFPLPFEPQALPRPLAHPSHQSGPTFLYPELHPLGSFSRCSPLEVGRCSWFSIHLRPSGWTSQRTSPMISHLKTHEDFNRILSNSILLRLFFYSTSLG